MQVWIIEVFTHPPPRFAVHLFPFSARVDGQLERIETESAILRFWRRVGRDNRPISLTAKQKPRTVWRGSISPGAFDELFETWFPNHELMERATLNNEQCAGFADHNAVAIRWPERHQQNARTNLLDVYHHSLRTRGSLFRVARLDHRGTVALVQHNCVEAACHRAKWETRHSLRFN